jgi:hypothetical protein
MRRAGYFALALTCVAAPALAQQTVIPDRTAAFAALPHWSGYWVSEYQAGTTIGGRASAGLPLPISCH